MQFPVMVVTNDGKNLMSEAVQSGNKIKFEEVVIDARGISPTATIEAIEAITYDWITNPSYLRIRGDVTKVTLQTDDVGKSFINISGEIFPNGTPASLNAYILAITARIGDGPLKLFGIARSDNMAKLSFGTSGTTKIHVSANISTASVGTDIIAYTFDSNYVTGDDFDMLSQTLRSDVEVARRTDLANRHYYNNPIDAIRYSSPMNSFKLRSGLYPELSLNMEGDSTQENRPLSFTRLEHERYSLVLGMNGGYLNDQDDPQICVSGTFIKADGTVVAIQDRLNNLTSIRTSTLYQDTFPQGTPYVVVADILVSYDDTTLDTEIILEYEMVNNGFKLVASISPRTGVMNWIKNVGLFKSATSIGYLDVESEFNQMTHITSYTYRLYKYSANKQDASRFAYTWTDRELAPNTSFENCVILDVALFNNVPHLIMRFNENEIPNEDWHGLFAVPHDLIPSQLTGGPTIHFEYDLQSNDIVSARSNYLVIGSLNDVHSLVSPFKSVPNDSEYEIAPQTVITAYGYKELDSDSEFVTTPWALNPNTDYTVLCKQRVDTDIKYVVCNGRLIPHID